MKKIVLSLVATAVVSTGVMAEGFDVKDVEVSANVAMTSNYVWRGMSQNGNSPAIQGGIDLAYDKFYAGTWGSNVDVSSDKDGKASMEMDFYAGYANDYEGFDYDVGFIQYAYPNAAKAANFAEAYVSLAKTVDKTTVSVTYSYGVKTNDTDPEDNIELGASVELPMDVTADLAYGMYNKDNYYSVGATKEYDKYAVNVAFTGMDYDDSTKDSENNLVATISASF